LGFGGHCDVKVTRENSQGRSEIVHKPDSSSGPDEPCQFRSVATAKIGMLELIAEFSFQFAV
jgi:hypothetical protein